MREILFRGKSMKTICGQLAPSEWLEGGLFCDPILKRAFILIPNKHAYLPGMGNMGAFDICAVNPETVGQFTGLTDKNGKRIFEGDIVQYHAIDKLSKSYLKRYFVDMDKERRGWWPFACGDGCGCCEEDTLYPGDCEVIGNIHDSPELLDEKRE